MTHFAFLKTEWPQIAASAIKAESLALGDPRTCCFYARRTLELMVGWLYDHDATLKRPYQDQLSALIAEPSFQRLLESRLMAKARLLKDLGNLAVHGTKPVREEDAVSAVRDLFHLAFWMAHTYGRQERPSPDLVFRGSLLPAPDQDLSKQTQAQLQRMQEEAAAKDKALQEAQKGREDLEAELEKAKAEIALIKAQNQAVPDTHDYTEMETRHAIIDVMLHQAGWALDQARDREFEILGMPNNADAMSGHAPDMAWGSKGGHRERSKQAVPPDRQGIGYADYVLWGDDGKPLAVVEAKRTTRDPKEGKRQAELYADGLERMFGQRPVIFYTNGYEHWIWDDALYPPREIQGFLAKSELELAILRRSTRKSLSLETIDTEIAGRAYQQRTIRRVSESFEQENHRKALLVMATGAGKTRTVIALCDLLMRANWAKRILFLADRLALVKQAAGAFKKHLPGNNPINLCEDKKGQGRIYVATYPTMMGLIDDMEDGRRRFGPGHFDLVVIDEAHRSVYKKYQAIFRYFDSFLVGLTATPRDEVDRDTYQLFDLERGVPTDAYELDEAIRDGYLVPWKTREVPVKFHQEGIHYDQLSDEEKEQWDNLEWPDGEIPDEVTPPEMHSFLFNTDTVDKILGHLMKHGLKVAGGDRLGKTIIFARNHEHAELIVQRFDTLFPHLKGHFCRVIDFKTHYVQSLIDDFSNPDKAPHIAVSVDMLDTGIDIPEVLNLAFFKPVRSKTKFWQMIGRGTRLCKDLFGPDMHKECFSIFDFFENFEYFRQQEKPVPDPVPVSLSEQIWRRRAELIVGLEKTMSEHTAEGVSSFEKLRMATAQLLADRVASMNRESFQIQPHLRLVECFEKPEAWSGAALLETSEAITVLGGLPSAMDDGGEEAKRFDLLILNLQLALLKNETGWERQQDRLVKIARVLNEKGAIPMVAAQMELIQEIGTDLWWEDLNLPILEDARNRLRDLAKFVEKAERKVLYGDFQDALGEEKISDPDYFSAGVDMERFRTKARRFLQEHENHFAILRLKQNQGLTPTDLEELERMLREADIGNEQEWEKAVEESHGLGLFIRSLVGLSRAAAKEAFAAFIQNLNSNQIEFTNLIIDHLTEKGIVEPGLLYDSPYTDLAPTGPNDVFTPSQLNELLGILDDVKQKAVA